MLKASLAISGKTVRQSSQLKMTATERAEELQKIRSKHLHDALQEVPQALELLSQATEKRAKADLLCTLADIHLGMGSLDDSKEAAMLARDVFHDLDDLRGEHAALLVEMDAHIADKDGSEALDVGKEIVKMFRKAKDRRGEAEGMLTLMSLHQMTGQVEDMMKLASDLRTICREERDVKMEGQVIDALMQAYIQSGNIDNAIRMSEEAMEVYRKANDKSGEAMALHACGCLELDRFFKEVGQQLDEFKKKGCVQQYYKEVDMAIYDKARGRIDKAVGLFKEAGDEQGQAMAEEAAWKTERKATMLNDPDTTTQVFKDGRMFDVVWTWNPGAKKDAHLSLGDFAG